ncbi:MAG: hypothetical protein EZS28_033329 [Streblomastix strix]|uniref:Uncharacterized protein n=1 Tax=Streblomastix strix TaxID=222440 RepID=A0A5J4UN05_9EUKA|nr:MAG: hypothetical protein EZS28_033329 [Streblomastix strix]
MIEVDVNQFGIMLTMKFSDDLLYDCAVYDLKEGDPGVCGDLVVRVAYLTPDVTGDDLTIFQAYLVCGICELYPYQLLPPYYYGDICIYWFSSTCVNKPAAALKAETFGVLNC